MKQCSVQAEVCMYQNIPKSIEHPFQKKLLLFDVGGIKGHVLNNKLNFFFIKFKPWRQNSESTYMIPYTISNSYVVYKILNP